jgi:hypothetical protein
MPARSKRVAGGWVAGLALCWSIGCDAAAEPPAAKLTTSSIVLSPPHVINAAAPIPSNGGLLISGFGGPELAVTVTSSDDPEAPPIAGSVHSLFHYQVWVGEAPLPAGAYSVAIDRNFAGGGTSTAAQFVEPRTPARPALESSALLNIARDVPVFDCCWSLTDRIPPLLSCFPIQTVDQATLAVTLATTEPLSALSQLLFRVSAVGGERANPGPLGEHSGALTFSAHADSYCYEVEAIEITTGASYLFDGPARCIPHGSEAALEVHEVAVDSARLDRAVCPAPPANLNDAWCARNLAACEAEAEGTTACSLAGHVCRGEPRPAGMVYDPSGSDETAAGSGGESGASGMSAGGAGGAVGQPSAYGDDAGGDDAGGDDLEATKRAYGCGCRVMRARPSNPGTWLTAIGVLTALSLRRKGFQGRHPAR